MSEKRSHFQAHLPALREGQRGVDEETLRDIGYQLPGDVPLPEAELKSRIVTPKPDDALDEFGARPAYLDAYEKITPENAAASQAGLAAARLALEQAQKPEPKQ